jgi:3',5'-cyclic-AMP phosphodiesterase
LQSDDGIDRRGFLKCMAWTGTGLAWAMVGGVPRSVLLGGNAAHAHDLFFVQLSDSHMGFDKPANAHVAATFQAAIDKINALPVQPSFLLHTGDISHLSQPAQFDQVDEMIRGARTTSGKVFYVPGEHDVLSDNGAQYRQRYGASAVGNGWYSFDSRGVHFIGLVNVLDLKPGGLGNLGADQLAWLARDVAHLSSSTPIVVFAHVPLWAVYPTWGWGTDDGTQALALLARFGSVTVLNGHIHQVVQKVEGHMTFHTALSTAFPQPSPGTAQAPGPVTVDAAELRRYLGLSSVTYLARPGNLAVVDSALEGGILTAGVGAGASTTAARIDPATIPPNQIAIDNFSFAPPERRVAAGTKIQWVNRDDIPHRIGSADAKFPLSPVLDTNQGYTYTFAKPGTYKFFCTLHPTMQGVVIVT